jgi:hypothetical protein
MSDIDRRLQLLIREYDKRTNSLSASAARFELLAIFLNILLGFASGALVVLGSLTVAQQNESIAGAVLGIQLAQALFVSTKVIINPSKKAAVFQQCAKEYNDLKRDVVVLRDEWQMSAPDNPQQRYIDLARLLNQKEDKIYADQPLQIFSDRVDTARHLTSTRVI